MTLEQLWAAHKELNARLCEVELALAEARQTNRELERLIAQQNAAIKRYVRREEVY